MYTFPPELIPRYVAGAASVLVGLFVLFRGRDQTRIPLGGWLLALGLSHLAAAAFYTAPTYGLFLAWIQVDSVMSAIATIMAIWFIAVFARISPRAHWVAWSAAGATALLAVIQLWNVHAFTTYAPLSGADGFYFQGAAGGIAATPTLGLLWLGVDRATYALLILALAAGFRAAGNDRRPVLLLVMMMLTVQVVYTIVDELLFMFRAWSEWLEHIAVWLAVLGVLADALALGVTLAAVWMTRDGKRLPRGRTLVLAGAAVVGILSGLLLDNNSLLLRFVSGTFGLIFPFGVAYAALRGQFPGWDRGARITVRSGTLAGMFLAVGFIASEAAAEFFGAQSGNEYWGIAAAGLLVFAIAPMQRAADRIAVAALPAGHPATPSVWEEMVRLAWADGKVSPAERLRLDAARERLGVAVAVAAEVEKRILEELARPDD